MNRRRFLGTCVAGALAVPPSLMAQPIARVHRLGFLVPTEPPKPSQPPGAVMHLLARLQGLGYTEGRNLVVERRWADGKIDRLPGLARELVQLKLDVIVAIAGSALRAARAVTTTIPIVMMAGPDAVAGGLVASLTRPGGNITGVLVGADDTLVGKRLELLKQAVPRSTRIALLARDDPGVEVQLDQAEKAASSLGVKLTVSKVQDGNYDDAFARIAAEQPSALLVLSNPVLFRDMKRIIALAARYRLPAIYDWRENADEGGLMAYGSSLAERSRRAATYVDRIFRGANPAELPVEQPTKFDFVINLRTAKSLGLAIPASLMARADHVIE